jgi:hypothetical protein
MKHPSDFFGVGDDCCRIFLGDDFDAFSDVDLTSAL